jgi:hypothetical protein
MYAKGISIVLSKEKNAPLLFSLSVTHKTNGPNRQHQITDIHPFDPSIPQSLLTTLKLLLGLSSTPTKVGSCPANKSSVELPRLSEGYPLPALPLATPLSVYGRLGALLPATPSLLRSELVLLVPSCEDNKPTIAGTFSPRAWRCDISTFAVDESAEEQVAD